MQLLQQGVYWMQFLWKIPPLLLFVANFEHVKSLCPHSHTSSWPKTNAWPTGLTFIM